MIRTEKNIEISITEEKYIFGAYIEFAAFKAAQEFCEGLRKWKLSSISIVYLTRRYTYKHNVFCLQKSKQKKDRPLILLLDWRVYALFDNNVFRFLILCRITLQFSRLSFCILVCN